jgi:hypothetical protein
MNSQKVLLELELDLLRTMKDETIKKVQEVIKDRSVPLAERWDLFENAKDVLPRRGWVIHLKELEKNRGFNWYDTFGFDRHQEVSLVDVVNDITGNGYEEEDLNPDFCSWVDVDQLKEEILESGYSSFIFDW